MGMGKYDNAPYTRGGREGAGAEVDRRVHHGDRGRAGRTGSPPHQPCAGTMRRRRKVALA
jgi:hypothetical protein